jgi:hypothetical protein
MDVQIVFPESEPEMNLIVLRTSVPDSDSPSSAKGQMGHWMAQ